MLRVAAHPGVVELVAVENPPDPDALILRRVQGATLREQATMPPEILAWTGAALATTVADLHDIGVVHLALEPSHVIVDAAGRPVLCGFGEARCLRPGEELETCKRRDVTALARLLIGASQEPSATRGIKALRAAAGSRRSRWTVRGTDARALARAMAATRPTAAPRRLRRKHSLALTALIVAAVLAAAVHTELTTKRSSAAPGSLRRACPSVDHGCRVIPASQDVLLSRYRIRGVTGETLLGRWDCSGNATPAVLDRLTGRLWVFDTWPAPGQVTTARLVATVPGAYAPLVVPSPGSSTCDTIELSRRGEHPLVLTMGRQ